MTKTYLMNPASGEIVCPTPRCAGATLLASYEARPNGKNWRGINGEPFTRFDHPEDLTEIREMLDGAVCSCEMSA